MFKLPVNDGLLYGAMFEDYIKYLLGVFDVHFHMIQIEYPFEQQKAYELACKMMVHCSEVIDKTCKPGIMRMKGHLKKEKEPDLSLNYINILHHLCISIKWLARGLSHAKDEDEKTNCYSAINEAKTCAQRCYDFFENVTAAHQPYYYAYVERWMDYIANTFSHYKGLAENVDYITMETAYNGPLFESGNIMEKKDKIEPYSHEGYENFA